MTGKPPQKAERGLDLGKVQTKLDRLLQAIGYKLEREELPSSIVARPLARAFLLVNVPLARSTFRAICYIWADKRLNQHDWRWEYTLILPLLNTEWSDSYYQHSA